MAMTSSNKWACPTCTFNNWQSLPKCVLCGSSKPIDEVIPRTPVAKYRQQNSGWSKLSSSHPGGMGPSQSPSNKGMEPNTPALDSSSCHGSNVAAKGSTRCKTKGKWTCVSCNYLNWSNAGQCTSCGTPRPRPSRNETGRAPNRSSESILLYASGAVGGASVSGSCDVPLQPAAKAKNGRHGNRGGQGICGDENRKWKCQHCTYENWPRTPKCTMCLRPKTRTPSPPLSGAEGSALSTPSLPSPHSLHSRTQPPSPHPHSPTPPNSNTTLLTTPTPSPALLRAHSNSNDTCEARSNSKDIEAGAGFNANKLVSSCNIPPAKDTLADTGTKMARDRRISDRYNSIPRQIQLKSDTDEVRQIRNTLSNSDWLFLNACVGIINSDLSAVKAYLRQDGDRARQLTKNECLVLGQPSKFTLGSTLVHLAIRFQRSEMLSLLLTPAPSDARKRLPSESNHDLAASIREEVGLSLHQHKGDWPCYFFTQITTFILPAEMRRFCSAVQKRVLDEIVDKDVAKELESEVAIINWSAELVDAFGSKLYPLWNRTAGDCLLDSVLQATWGVVDRDSTLRRSMADSLVDGASSFYSRWKEFEQRLSQSQGFVLDEAQLKQDWTAVLALADQTGRSLEQVHIFALAHILRRPIIVYGVRMVKNYRGENLGFANFEGVYLPLLWEASFCWKTPIALAYTRGHFSALVSITSSPQPGASKCSNQTPQTNHVTYLPLVDSDGRFLCMHFLNEQEIGCEERLLTEYCECYLTPLGTLTAKQELSSPQQHSLVVSLVDQWLDRFRKMDKRREAAASSSAHSDSGSDH